MYTLCYGILLLDLDQIKESTNFSKSFQEAIYFISVIHKEQNDNIERNFETLRTYYGGGKKGFFDIPIFSDKFKINDLLTWRYEVEGKYAFVAEYFIGKGIKCEIDIEKSSNNHDIKVSCKSNNSM